MSQGGEARREREFLEGSRYEDKFPDEGGEAAEIEAVARYVTHPQAGHYEDCASCHGPASCDCGFSAALGAVRSSGSAAQNHEGVRNLSYDELSKVERWRAREQTRLEAWAKTLQRNLDMAIAERDQAQAELRTTRFPQGEDHDLRREIGGNAPLRERIADELAHNDECGSGPVSWQEYLADADAILRIVRESSPQGEDHEETTERRRERAVRRYVQVRRSPQGEDHEEARRAAHDAAQDWVDAADGEVDTGHVVDEALNAYLRSLPSPVSGTEPDTARLVEALHRAARVLDEVVRYFDEGHRLPPAGFPLASVVRPARDDARDALSGFSGPQEPQEKP